jgi:ribokinase
MPPDDSAHPRHIVVLGGLNLDFVFKADRLPQPGETVIGEAFNTTPGGKAGNQAVAAAQLLDLPSRVRMTGRVGDDWMGLELRQALDATGVEHTNVHVDLQATSGVAAIYVDAQGENTVTAVYGANANLDATDAARAIALLPEASVLLAQLETPWPATAQVIDSARQHHVTVILDPAPIRDLPPNAFANVDILTPNQGEAERWTGISVTDVASAIEAGRKLRHLGPQRVIVTLGAEGVVLVDADTAEHYPAFTVDVVSTLAAGDAFNGGLAAGLAEQRPLPQAIRRAQASAALSTTRLGAQAAMPTRAEVDAFLSNH